MNYWIMCRSLTHAQRSARLLERSGITATVMKAEAVLSEGGCRYAVKLTRHFEDALKILRGNDMIRGRIYLQNDAGGYEEIRV